MTAKTALLALGACSLMTMSLPAQAQQASPRPRVVAATGLQGAQAGGAAGATALAEGEAAAAGGIATGTLAAIAAAAAALTAYAAGAFSGDGSPPRPVSP